MAEAQQGRGGAASLEAELTCPICLGLYQEPVSLSCGHSFCRRCVKDALGAQQHSQEPYTCPMCRVDLGPTVELQNNFQLGNIVEAFQATTSKEQGEGFEKGKTGVVLCEYCLDRPQPAVSTCLVCAVSLCQAHLNKHNAKASQQEHILVEVGAGEVEERRCPEHGKLLECYCQKEDKCICVLCSIAGAHKGHEVITMKEERDKQLVKLPDTMKELQESKRGFVTALEELQKCENQIKTNTKTVTSQLQEQIKNIRTQLDEKEKYILRWMNVAEDAQLEDVAKARKKMEQKRDQAEQNLQALQKIKEQPDTFLFLKELKLVTDRIAGLDLDTKRVDVKVVQLNQSMITRCQALRKELMLLLEHLLRDVYSKLIHQMEFRRSTSATDTCPDLHDNEDLSQLVRQRVRRQEQLHNNKYKK